MPESRRRLLPPPRVCVPIHEPEREVPADALLRRLREARDERSAAERAMSEAEAARAEAIARYDVARDSAEAAIAEEEAAWARLERACEVLGEVAAEARPVALVVGLAEFCEAAGFDLSDANEEDEENHA